MYNEERYVRQVQVAEFGEAGQRALRAARIGVVGCGGLGSHQLAALVRMGVGLVRFADWDVVSLTNLHRQYLFAERDVGRAKVTVAAQRLAVLNSAVVLEPRVERVTDFAVFADGLDLVLDATDDVETRFGLNDFCVAKGLPFVYGGVAGTAGFVLPVVPGGACLRCLFAEMPAEGVMSCGSHGVFPPLVALTAAVQVAQAMRIVCGAPISNTVFRIDAWGTSVRALSLKRREGCVCCGRDTPEVISNM